jgi:hypothetical protein
MSEAKALACTRLRAHIASDSVSSMPQACCAPSNDHMVVFSVWSG